MSNIYFCICDIFFQIESDYFVEQGRWMNQIRELRGSLKEDFYNGINVFVEFTVSNNGNDIEIRCLCSNCKHLKYLLPDIVKVH